MQARRSEASCWHQWHIAVSGTLDRAPALIAAIHMPEPSMLTWFWYGSQHLRTFNDSHKFQIMHINGSCMEPSIYNADHSELVLACIPGPRKMSFSG